MTTVCSTAVCGTGGWNGPLPGDPDNNSILTATAEFGGVQLSWTLPSTNAHAVAYTNIYRSIGDDFATAIPFTAVSGTGYFDFQAAKVIRQYFYWIQHVSVNGTVLDPIGPASATAMPQIDQVIAALTGRVESSALATALRERIDVITDLENGLTQIDSRVTSENSVFAQELSAIRDDLTGALAYIDSQQTISIDERQALVTSLNTQLAQFGDGLYAAIQDEATTRADETGDLFAQKTLKIDLAGNVAGYGLSARVDPTGEFTSDFQVRADTFSIAPPSLSSNTAPGNPYQGMVWVDTSVIPNVTKWYNEVTAAWQTTPVKGAVPFIVKTTPETIDGYTAPAGVYIDSAYITRLSANQIDTRGLIVRDLTGAPVIQMGTAIDWSKLGGKASNLSGLGYTGSLDATRNVYRGSWASGVSYTKGDIAIKDSYGWSCEVSHVSSGSIMPPTYPDTNSYWTLAAVSGGSGVNGADAISAILSNESHVFSAASDGAVTDYTNSGTAIRVYEGSTELQYDGAGTSNGTWKITASGSSITPSASFVDDGAFVTVGAHSAITADTAAITYTITGRSSAGVNFVITKQQSFSKSKAGNTGAVGTAYWLQSNAPTVQKSIAGVYTPTAVTYSLMSATGTNAPVAYAGRFIIATSTDGTTYTDQYTSSANESSKAYAVPAGIKTIRVRAYLAGGVTTLIDEQLTTVVSDGTNGAAGANAISAIMSNEAHVFPAATDGTVATYAGSGTEVRVYEGATELLYDGVGTSNGTWAVSSTVTNIVRGTLTDSGTFLTVGTHSGVAAGTDTSSIIYTITGKTSVGTPFTITKNQTFTKSKAGATGSTGPSVLVTPDRVTTFTATDGTLDASQANIVFTASVSGVASPTYVWSFSGFQTAPTNSGTSTQTITAAQFGTAKSAIVTCTVNGTYTDKVTIVRLEKSTAAAGATVGAPAGTYVGSTLAQDVESTTGAQSKASAAQTAAQNYAAAQAALAETQAKAYADGKVTAEETRAIADATAKAEAARVAAVNAASADATAKANAVLGASLQKAGDAITGPVTFATNGGILAATDADNGVFMGPNGLVGKMAGATTFAIDTAGNASFGGNLDAATGTFAGSLSAATGSFSGTLTADAISAVNTINIAGNAVTIPVAASGVSGALAYNYTRIVVSAVIDVPADAPVFISAQVVTTAKEYGSPGSCNATISLWRDGVQLTSITDGAGDSWGKKLAVLPGIFAKVDSPGEGIHTYAVTIQRSGSTSFTDLTYATPSLFVFVAKR